MPKHYTLNEQQWQQISVLLPKLKSRGRPWRANRDCLEGILWILRTGARWKDLPRVFPSPATCWRRLRMWETNGVLRKIWRVLLGELGQAGQLDWKEAFADATFVPAKKGGDAIGKTKRGKGSKCMLVTDGEGLPIAVSVHSA